MSQENIQSVIKKNYRKKNFFEHLQVFNKQQLEEFIQKASDHYYNDQPIISDKQFDLLIDYVKKNYNDSKVLQQVGASVKENKIKLPYYMGSLEKKKKQKQVELWLNKNKSEEYFVSEKLDGISCLYYGGRLYSRGNGYEGQDITNIKQYVNYIPKKDKNIQIRGELVISKKNFEQNLRQQGYSNPRNSINGIISQKKLNVEQVKCIDFISYEVLNINTQEAKSYSPTQSVKIASKSGFKFVGHEIVKKDQVNKESLSTLLQIFTQNSQYVIDGIVITVNRENQVVIGKNPKYSFAFKEMETLEYKQTQIKEIEWNVSKDMKLIPTIHFDTIILEDTQVSSATAHNANYVVEKGLGKGAIVEVYKAGHIIPAVKSVIQRVKIPELPQIQYKWDKNMKNIYITELTEEYKQKLFENFFMKLKVPNLSIGTIQLLYSSGFNTIDKVINIKIDQLNKLPKFKQKKSEKLYNSIQEQFKNRKIPLEKIIIASNSLGTGFQDKKLSQILKDNPWIVQKMGKIEQDDELSIGGKQTQEKFRNGWNSFIDFCKLNKINFKDFI